MIKESGLFLICVFYFILYIGGCIKLKNTNLEIRDARSAELDAVAQLIVEAYRQYESVMPPESWNSYVEDILDIRSRLNKSQLIVALVEGRLAGSVTLYLDSSGTPEDWPPEWAGVRLLAVRPAFRGCGIGRALMDECIRRCREGGIKTISLHTTEMMAVAFRMYEQMGFRHVPEYDFHFESEVVVKAFRLDL
jgi:GNAT superfamily N-acetyltransferase